MGERIEIAFRQSLIAARALNELSNLLRQAAEEELLEALAEVGGGWKGEAAAAFLSRGSKMYHRLLESAVSLAGAAETAEKAAQRFYEYDRYGRE